MKRSLLFSAFAILAVGYLAGLLVAGVGSSQITCTNITSFIDDHDTVTWRVCRELVYTLDGTNSPPSVSRDNLTLDSIGSNVGAVKGTNMDVRSAWIAFTNGLIESL